MTAAAPVPASGGVLEAMTRRQLRRISAEMSSGSIALREAVDRLHGLYVLGTSAQARVSAPRDWPAYVRDSYVTGVVTDALREVVEDRVRSAPVLARAERRLGEVLVLPDGSEVGPRLEPPAPLRPQDLW